MTRYGFVPRVSAAQIAPYLPQNYRAEDAPEGAPEGPGARIIGEDRAGWTLDGYVLPRLASGLYFGTEIIFASDNL
jgi:hypothetical protein